MKKVLPIMLALALIISLVACFPAITGEVQQDEPADNPGVMTAQTGGVDAPPIGNIQPVAFVTDGPGKLYLHIGSPIALSDGKILPLDSDNPGLTPILHRDRTLVPLRFVSEYFGADVSYDAESRTGIVKSGGKAAEFPVGGDYFILDGKRISLDTEALNIDGRIMLPLRALCEQVLGLSVDYRESVILIAETADLVDEAVKEVKSKIGMYVKVSDLEALTRYFDENTGDGYRYDIIEDAPMTPAETESSIAGSAEPVASAPPPQATDESASSTKGDTDGHSSTNTQVEGIDEGDIIKTDGKYIYLSCYDTIKIISAGSAMSIAAQIDVPGENITDMYIDSGRLIVIGNESARVSGAAIGRETAAEYWTNFVCVSIYDTSDMSDIKLLRSYKAEGYLSASRKQGDYLYILSSQDIWYYGDGIDPRPLSGENGKLAPMPVSDIMIAPGCPANGFLTLSAINIRDAGEEVASETITVDGYGGVQYMSNSAMYVAAQDYMYGGSNLNIARFSVNGGRIGYAGSGAVRGSLNNQFSMDEYNGHLRVATTEWDGMNKNNLFVLDGNMQIAGSVEGFAPDERIYSVRFMGGRGYVVTFRQTDPLFVFDLKDPANPKITGELKVPGFSTYLHPVSENVILGVGNEVYDVYTKDRQGLEVVTGQRTGGIKLSLFDVSDMGKPREMDTLVIGDQGYSELLYNHKAAMFKADENIIAFCAEISDGVPVSTWWNGALVISYAGNKLSERGRIEADANYGVTYGYSFSGQRLVYIGSTLYYAQNNVIRSFDIDTLSEMQTLKLG